MLAERRIPVHQRHIEASELEGSRQCWLTGTAAEVTPVGSIGDYSFEVGALAREMVEKLREAGPGLTIEGRPATSSGGRLR